MSKQNWKWSHPKGKNIYPKDFKIPRKLKKRIKKIFTYSKSTNRFYEKPGYVTRNEYILINFDKLRYDVICSIFEYYRLKNKLKAVAYNNLFSNSILSIKKVKSVL